MLLGTKRKATLESQEEELILLGCRKATPVKAPPTSAFVNLSTLPWHGRSAQREEIRMLFHQQLLVELRQSDQLFAAFLPFLSNRGARQIECSSERCIPPPKAFFGTSRGSFVLRDYQVEGVQFLLDNFHKGFSCILGDDMGLGKTAQVCAFLQHLHDSFGVLGPHLIIAPLSTLSNWAKEMKRWAPALTVVRCHGSKEKELLKNDRGSLARSVVVTTYQSCLSNSGFFRSKVWCVMAVDEAHALKEESRTNKLCSKLQSIYRLAITGTPIQNNVHELWRIVKYLFPLIAESRDNGNDDDASDGGQNNAALEAVELLKWIMLRRTKSRLSLPSKTEQPRLCLEPSPLQSELITLLSMKAQKATSDSLVGLFMNMRKICNHPLNVKLKEDKSIAAGFERLLQCGIGLNEQDLVLPSAKMMKLDMLLPKLRKDGHRVVIFSNFACQVDILEGYAKMRDFTYERLDGSVSRTERELSITRFNHPSSRIFLFLITTQAGGVGISLTGADTVIFYDSHYNPQMDCQAADRTHRIGQTKPVTIYRLAIKDSIEEKILEVAAEKAKLSQFVIDGQVIQEKQSIAKYFTHEELRAMMMGSGSKALCANSTERWYATLESILSNPPSEEFSELKPRKQKAEMPKKSTTCFICGDALGVTKFHCSTCPKAYHQSCLDNPRWNVYWSCPRHSCCECLQKADTLFCCIQCPSSYCIECLSRDFLSDMTSDGLHFKRVHKTYYGMEKDSMCVKPSMYYILCDECSTESHSTITISSDSSSDSTSTFDSEFHAS